MVLDCFEFNLETDSILYAIYSSSKCTLGSTLAAVWDGISTVNVHTLTVLLLLSVNAGLRFTALFIRPIPH